MRTKPPKEYRRMFLITLNKFYLQWNKERKANIKARFPRFEQVLGMPQSTVYSWLKGRFTPTPKTMEKLKVIGYIPPAMDDVEVTKPAETEQEGSIMIPVPTKNEDAFTPETEI